MDLQIRKDTFSEKLNLSIAIFDIWVLPVFEEGKDGKVHPGYKSVKRMIDLITDHGNFNEKIVIAQEGQFGTYDGNGYQDGMLGLLQRREADVSLLAMPIHTPQPPGQFSPVVTEEAYYLNSFIRNSSMHQDVTSSFTLFDRYIWILILSTIYLLEVISTYQYQHSISFLTRLLSSAGRLPSILLIKQSVVYKSLIKLTQLLLMYIMVIIFMASFKTTCIGRLDEPRVNTLRDIVDQDKTPCFIQGLSMFELFKDKVTKDYDDVYQLAERKKRARQFLVGERNESNTGDPFDEVCIISDTMRKLANVVKMRMITEDSMAGHSYWSEKSFYQSLSALLVNPRHDVHQIKKRLHFVTSKLLQSALFERTRTSILRELIIAWPIPTEQYTEHSLNKRLMKLEEDRKFEPLKLDGMLKVFIGLFIFLSIAAIIFIFEKIVVIIYI